MRSKQKATEKRENKKAVFVSVFLCYLLSLTSKVHRSKIEHFAQFQGGPPVNKVINRLNVEMVAIQVFSYKSLSTQGL